MEITCQSPPRPPQQLQPDSSNSGFSELEARLDPKLAELVKEIKDYQLTHGNLLKWVRYESSTQAPAAGTSVSITPTKFHRRCFDQAWGLQELMSELYIRAAADEDWLGSVFKPLLAQDPLLGPLWDVHLKVKMAGTVQEICCGIFRTDYMLHANGEDVLLKQVEINHIAVAGICHASNVSAMHRHLDRIQDSNNDGHISKLPLKNESILNVVSMLGEAHRLYSPTIPRQQPACILMIVQPYNFNIADERPIEYSLWDKGIPCFRCIWNSVLTQTTLADDRTLLFRPSICSSEFEVSVIYFRAGFETHEYDDAGKATRLRLEVSRAIKCPDVLTHLTTFKIVQQALTAPEIVKKFLSSRCEDIKRVLETFMPMHLLDSSNEGLEMRRIAKNPNDAVKYVLKPNLEGGGHNIYRKDIPQFLANVPEDIWHNYILMRLIEPPATSGTLMIGDGVYEGEVVSELGIFATVIWRKQAARESHHTTTLEILMNKAAGWSFKSKPRPVDEMSVAKGYGCFDSPELVD